MNHSAPSQMSEAFVTAAFLSLSGGLQDAYTYFARGGVFANAQTGNIVLLSHHLFGGQLSAALRCLIPLVSFALGIAAAELTRQRCRSTRLHWRQLVLAAEIGLLLGVGFLPESWNPAANALVSFACAMQVQTFRKVRGNVCSTTMCIGNLRSGTQYLYDWLKYRDPAVLSRALQYFGTIVLFGAGAAAGSLMTMRFGMWVIWVSSALLSVSFLLMFWKTDEKELQAVGRKLERELCTVEEKAEQKLEHLEEKHR